MRYMLLEVRGSYIIEVSAGVNERLVAVSEKFEASPCVNERFAAVNEIFSS